MLDLNVRKGGGNVYPAPLGVCSVESSQRPVARRFGSTGVSILCFRLTGLFKRLHPWVTEGRGYVCGSFPIAGRRTEIRIEILPGLPVGFCE